MYQKDGRTISLEDAQLAAKRKGLNLEDWLEQTGFSAADEGKLEGPVKTTPPTEPKKKTPAGDSSSGDISLESPEIDFSITADDLKADEGDVVKALNAKLSQYGLIAKESTGIGSFNAINIEKRKSKEDEKGFFETIGSAPETIFKAGYDFFTSFNVGADLSQKELEENAAAINALVKDLADTSYLSKAQEQLGDKWGQFKEAVTPEEKTDKELTKEYKAARLDKFEKVRAEYNKINANKFRATGANQNVKTEEPTVEDFANQEEYDAYLAWQKGDLINDPTKEELSSFDLERRRAFESAKSSEFGSDLSVSERQALDALVDNKVKVLEKDIKNFDDLRNKGEIIVNRANDLIKQYNDNPTLDNFDIANAAIKEAREVETAVLDNAKSLQESLGEKEYIGLAVDVLKKDYNRLRQMRNVAKGMAADVWMLGAELDEMMGISYEGEYDKAVALKREVMRESEGFQKNLTIDEISGAKDAGRWVAGAATNLLPSLGLAATGPAALPLFFMTGSGGKLGEMAVAEQDAALRLAKNAKYLEDTPDIDEIERAAIEAEMEEDSKTLNIEDWRKYSTAALYGTAEVVFERVGTLHILKNLGKTAKTLKPTNIKEGLKAVGKTWGEGLYREGGSEFATTITGNIGDIYILGEDKNVFEGGLESFAQGGLMGVSMVSINTPRLVKESVVSELATRKESKRLKEIMQRISELTNMPVQNIDLGALGRFGSLTPEVRKMVEELTLEADAIKDQILEGLGTKYNAQDLFEIGEHNRKLRKIESEWAQVAANPNYSASQLAAFEAEYRAKYEAEVEARDQILENEASIAENLRDANARSVSFDATQGYAMYNTRLQTESLLRINTEFDKIGATKKQSLNEEAKAELEKEGAEVTNESVKDRARKNYIDGKYRELIEKGRENVLAYIKANKDKGITPPESFDGDNATAALIERARELGYENINQLEKDLKSGVTEGLNWNGNKLVHMPNAIKNRRVGVFAHEVLHDEAEIGIQSKDGNAAGQALLDYLEKNQPDLFAQVKDRLDKNYVEVDGETGEARKNKYYQEEALTALSDLLADGYVPTANVMEQMKLLLSKILPKWVKLTDDAAVYQFVLNYNKAAHFGGKAKQGKPFVRAVGREPEDAEGRQSRTASAERAKEALDKMQEEGYDPNNFGLYDILNGMAGAQLNKYKIKGLQITDMEEAVADVVGRLYTERDVNKFDGRGSLYGYLNGRIKFRILDAFKANPIWVEDFGDIDAEGLTGKEVQKVAVEAVETTETTQEAPKYRSLLDAKTVSPEGVKTATEKVMSTVRVMKKRLDESVSKNVTVKPYIAELKKDFGKQIDIILKKEMGTVKDRALQKWLLKNKKAILENMTTTWLMTAMPNAIQKKVDGQWTSDWKGKKIDRETVSTDNAGRTSGAEMVRRLPKASLKMSDADFLSNFFDEKGGLIRGRKESLAKAIGEEVGFEIFSQALQDEASPIRQAFEQRQDLLQAQLGGAFVQEVARDIERGNVKYSITARQANELRQHEAGLISYLEKAGSVTESRLRSALFKVYLEENETSLTEEQLRKIAKDGAITVAKYFKKRKDIGDADFVGFVMNGMQQLEASTNLLEAANVTLEDIFGSYRSMMDVPSVQLERRAVELDFNIQLVEKEGLSGLIKILKWMGGHNYTSSKIGKGRGQYYANKDDYYKNNIALIPGVSYDGKTIYYKSEPVKIPTKPSQSVNKKEVFEKEYDKRKVEAEEAWSVLTEFLEFVRSTNNPVLWVATMKSLDSNMSSILKAAANVEYYFVGGSDSQLRYEHIIPTNYIMLQLTNHFWNKKIDLAKLQEAYSVAIIPTDMDENINLQYQSVMPLKFDPMKDSPIERYYNMTTFGMNYMRALEKIGGKNKGKVYGEKWVKFSQSAVQDANSKLNTAVEESTESVKFSKSKPRAVFMVGGPGAGKTNVGKGLKLGRRGYKVINQDIAVEALKEEANLPAREGEYTAEQRSLRSKIGAAARKAAQEKMEKYTNNRESMVVDGTGASFNATMKKIKVLEDAGYEVHLVFANTSLEEAAARNEARAERSLPQFVVEKSWEQVQESAAKYKEIYGERFYEVNTNELKIGEDLPKPLLDKLYKNLEVGPAKYSKTVNKEFNEILERKTGIGAEKVFSKVQAELRGAKKGRFKFFVAPGADDFRGLVHYAFAGKGKQGEADMAWFEEKLMDPYFKGIEAINRVRQQIKRDFKETIKTFRKEYKMLSKKIGDTGFTYDQALRVYMWNRQGTQVPGLSKRDTRLLLDAISKNPELVALADALLVVSRRTEWMEPGDYWQTQTVLSDLNGMTEKIGRKKYLAEFIENADIIFSEENLNKIEASKGRAHREALEDALYAMRNGSNRPSGSNKQVNAFINWINGSTGAIMFFNRRSALLQMLSFTNFINWSDNNPAKAAAAFANQKQYWSDWAMIFNSDKLKERRSGLKTDVSEAELANAANRSKGDPRAILAYLLKIGFTPTQIADSMAIATGGATFYRNRINKYVKEGMSTKDAEAQAWIDFTKRSDEAQQSSDPALVSQLQRSVLGRLVFAFANTPMQYTRLMKKAAMDLAAGRGNFTENVSKIAYYGFVQNFIFSSLQSALFALIPGFDDEDEELDDKEAEKLAAKEEAKVARVLNSMIDTIVRGSGVYGAVGVTIKNTILEYLKQEEKGFLADHTYTVLSATSISPPINSKLRKIYSATQTKKFERDELEVRPWAVATEGRPNFGPGWSIVGNLVSGTLNVPLDRVVDELNSIGEAMDKRNTTWQRIALALGWKTWDVGAVDEEGDLIKAAGKAKRKEEGIEKAKKSRAATNEAKKAEEEKLSPLEKAKKKRREAEAKRRKKRNK